MRQTGASASGYDEESDPSHKRYREKFPVTSDFKRFRYRYMADSRPQCGCVLSPGGLCPRCLMAAAAHTTLPTVSRIDPVTIEQVAVAFPQLQILEMIGQGGMGSKRYRSNAG